MSKSFNKNFKPIYDPEVSHHVAKKKKQHQNSKQIKSIDKMLRTKNVDKLMALS